MFPQGGEQFAPNPSAPEPGSHRKIQHLGLIWPGGARHQKSCDMAIYDRDPQIVAEIIGARPLRRLRTRRLNGRDFRQVGRSAAPDQ